MAIFKPVIRIEQPDAVVAFRNSQQGTKAAWRIAKISVYFIELYMPNILAVEPGLRMSICNDDMVAGDRL